MDSGNSGSLQSSSGAEEECNSRAVVHDHHQPHPPPPLPFNHHHHHHNMFDQNQINNPLLFTQQQHQLVNNNNNLDSLIWSKTLPPFPTPDQPTTTTTTKIPHPDPDRAPGRNPKKRSRASRRAPTTVLTTDTSNFRAMVQEFTGIPAPPFPSSSNTFPTRLSSTTSFDLFGRSMMMRSNTNTNTNNNFDYNLGIPPNYPSFPQKLPTSLLLDSTNLLTTMQMQNTMSSSSSLYLNHKLTPQNGFGVSGLQTQNIINHGLLHSTTLPDLVSTTTTTERNGDDQTASGKWNDAVNYSNEKAVDHTHHGEPWVCSSD